MKAIQKDFWREVRNTRSRFLSILILVALAVAFLSGLRSTAPDMKNTCDEYLDQQSFMDIQVLSTLGLTEEDLESLLDQPGVADGESFYVIDAFAHTEALDIVAKVYSMPERLNLLTLTAGRMPEAADECVVDEVLLTRLNLEVGDPLDLVTSGDYEDALDQTSFTIVGTVMSPMYISVERGTSTLGTGQVSAYVYVPQAAFDMDYYTAIYLTAEGAAEEVAFSEEYDQVVDGLIDQLEPVGEERARLRRESLVDEGNEQLAEAQEKLDDAKAEAQQELDDAWAELSDARAELDDGWAELRKARRTLTQETADARQKIEDGAQELADALAELENGEAEYADGVREYEDGLAEYQDGLKEYEDGLAEYEENRKTLDDGWKEYKDGLAEYQAGQKKLSSAYSQLQSGEAEYQSGKQQYETFASTYLLPGTSYATPAALGSALTAEGAAGGAAHDAVNTALTSLRQQITELKTTVAALDQLEAAETQLTAGIAEADQQITALEGTVSQLDGQIAALEAAGESEENTAALETLRTQRAQAAEGLQTAQATRDSLSQKKTEADAGLAQIDAGLAAQNMDRAGARTALAQLGTVESQLPADAEAVQSSYQQLLSARSELDSGWREYYSGQTELRSAWRQLQDAKAELDDGETQLAEGKAELEDAQSQLQDAKEELADAERELADARAELDDGWRDYEDGKQELADAEQELADQTADAEAEIADGTRDLQKGEQEYADGLAEYNDGKAEAEEKIADAENELADARRKVADIGDCEWYILSRDSNPGYLGFGQDADRMGNLASVFPVLFFLVAALVCLTTMTRMVEEQRVQIGSLKALGYTRWAISRKYLGYGLLPALLGGALGLVIGFTLFPKMIFTAYQIMYDLPGIQLSVYPTICAGSLAAAVACTTVATLAACLTTLADTPANLMRPRAPKAGKRVLLEHIRPLWRRMSFNQKVTARNLLRYQKRFWMTVIGIGGCTALIIAGFGLRSSLMSTMSIQYDELYHYTAQLAVEDNLLDTEREAIDDYIRESPDVTESLACRLGSVTAESDAYSTSAYLEAADPAGLADFVELRTLAGEPLTLSDDGVIIDQKLSELLDIGVGDTFVVDGDSRVTVRVAAVTEHYLAHFIYFSPAYYEEVFGTEYHSNAYLLTLTDSSKELCDAVFTDLMNLHGVVSATRMLNTRDTYLSSMERVDFVVVIVILSAAALALVVLYNLSNINITERKRELATIRVLGFYDREVSAYVNRENVVLTIFGIVFGILCGHFLHVWLVKSVEIDLMMFGRTTDPMAYLWASLLTTLFSVAVSLLAHRKMKKIDMVESLKSAE